MIFKKPALRLVIYIFLLAPIPLLQARPQNEKELTPAVRPLSDNASPGKKSPGFGEKGDNPWKTEDPKVLLAERQKRHEKLKKINREARIKDAAPRRVEENKIPIEEIKKQIHEIIQIDATLKQGRQQQASEIQRIRDQARIHQQILKDLEASSQKRNSVNASDIDEILKQEKIRLIQQQTRQNREMIENVDRGKKTL